MPKYGLLVRYPWQDLIYADFQIFNRWRWFSESLHQTGLVGTLTSNTDFRMNTGENLYLSSRVSAPIYDLGAWLYFITGSIDIAFFSKYIVLTMFSAYGLIQLIKRSASIEQRIPNTKFLIFAVLIASIMGHPLMMHEVGPMVFWYLFLTPSWILIFLDMRDYGHSNMLLNWKTYVLLILTMGSSDLFVFFYFPLFLFLAATVKSNFHRNLKNIMKGIILIELVLLLNKALYLYYTFEGDNVSNSGSWGLFDYTKNFIAPLFLSVLLPFFWGPAILFLNFVLLGLIMYFGIQDPRLLKRYLTIWLSMLFVLLFVGVLLHTIPLTREALPSAFRYHVAPWSIIIISMLPIFIDEILKKTNKPTPFEGNKKTITVLVVVAIMSLSSIEQFYSSVVAAGSKRIVDYDIRQWVSKDMPNCIRNASTNISSSEKAAQYAFLTANDENGRNDNLTSLIENPWELNGRTFNQWRYSTSRSNYLMLEKFGLKGLNTWAFTERGLIQSLEYANTLGINHLVTTTRLTESKQIKYLGECQVPEDLRSRFVPFKQLLSGVAVGNNSYEKNLFIYEIMLDKIPAPVAEVTSNVISYSIFCKVDQVYTLSTNYSSDLKVTNYENAQLTRNPESNLTMLKMKSCPENQIAVKIKSQSNILYIDVFFFVLYILTSLFLVQRIVRKRQHIQ